MPQMFDFLNELTVFNDRFDYHYEGLLYLKAADWFLSVLFSHHKQPLLRSFFSHLSSIEMSFLVCAVNILITLRL